MNDSEQESLLREIRAEREGVRLIALLASKKRFPVGEVLRMANDRRLTERPITAADVHSGRGTTEGEWIVILGDVRPDIKRLHARAMRSFIGFDDAPPGVRLVYEY